jgi:hypothetical protein
VQTRRAHTLPLATAALACLALAVLAPSLGAGQAGFSPTERRILAAGELVERPSPSDRGGRRFVGGTSYRVVERPAAEVWAALHDFDHYQQMLPSTNDTAVVERRRDGAVLRVGHSYGPISARYYLLVTFDERARHLEFRLDDSRPHDIDAAYGFCEVSRFDGDRALVTWAGRVDPGASILIEPMRPEIQRWLLRVPSTMRSYLQDGGGRDRYRD